VLDSFFQAINPNGMLPFALNKEKESKNKNIEM
jgi:hypothetical protein